MPIFVFSWERWKSYSIKTDSSEDQGKVYGMDTYFPNIFFLIYIYTPTDTIILFTDIENELAEVVMFMVPHLSYIATPLWKWAFIRSMHLVFFPLLVTLHEYEYNFDMQT